MSGAATAANAVREFRRWLPFSHDLAGDVHPERWRALGLGAEAARRLAECPRSRRLLSRRLDWILPGGVAEWEAPAALPEDESLALLAGDELWRRGLRFGAAKNRDAVARLVWRDDVAALKAEVGEDVYFFALRRAALLWRDAALGAAAGGGGASLAERIRADAGLGLGSWLAGLPVQLAARLRLKLPASCDPRLAEATGWPPARREEWRTVFRRIAGD